VTKFLLVMKTTLTLSTETHSSLNAIMTQSKNCPIGVNTTIGLKKYNYNRRYRHLVGCVSTNKLTSVLVLSDVVVIFFSSFVVTTPNGNFWDVPLLHSVSYMLH